MRQVYITMITGWMILCFCTVNGQKNDSLSYYASRINIDTSLELRMHYFQSMNRLFEEEIQNNPVLNQDIPEIFTLYPSDSLFVLYSYRFRMHTGKHLYKAYIKNLETGSILSWNQQGESHILLSKTKNYGNKNWYGAIYYNLLEKKYKGETLYFLFGYRDLDQTKNEKLIDVMRLLEDGRIELGFPVFEHPDLEEAKRYSFTYAQNASAKLNWDSSRKIILKDHLVPMSFDGVLQDVPDGSYEAFEWKKNKWNWIEKPYSHIYDEAPRPAPVKDNKNLFGVDEN
mgnify:CR=1 FL=1